MGGRGPVCTDGCRVARLEGELDIATAASLHEVLSDPVGELRVASLIVDLSAVTFLDCSSLPALEAAWRRCEERGGWTRLVYRDARIGLLLRVTNLDERFPRYATVLDARNGRIAVPTERAA